MNDVTRDFKYSVIDTLCYKINIKLIDIFINIIAT